MIKSIKTLLLFLILFSAFSCYADPGITIEIDIFIDKPSGCGEEEMV